MSNTIYMVCGVPGSGKTWVCLQLDQYIYVPHDRYADRGAFLNAICSTQPHKPLVIDCPFGERVLRNELESLGFEVRPYFIIESAKVVQERYRQREGEPLGQAHVTRSKTIIDRALEWKAPYGTSQEILERLNDPAP